MLFDQARDDRSAPAVNAAGGSAHDAPAAIPHIRLAELVGRLSLAFDVANDSPPGKAVRSVVLAVELGRRAGVREDDLRGAFWVSLLSHIDASPDLADMIGAAPGVPSPIAGQLQHIGNAAETAHQQHGRAGAIELVRRGAGRAFDHGLAQLFLAEQAELFPAIEDPHIFDRFLALEPRPVACADDRRTEEVVRALAIFADLRCPIFAGHSTGVAALAEQAANRLGLGAEQTRLLRWAALLHDVGRVSVPNLIWTRRGRLDWAEAERVRLHAYYTERVLSPLRALGPVAEIAATAHERLDGAGYPGNRLARSLLPGARILAAADMAFAMSEPRPYRNALGAADIARELDAEVGAGHLDASATSAVLASLGVKTPAAAKNTRRLSERELEVSRLIARGKMNKEIAEVLGISLHTVQNHVTHIFDKLGVHSRSGVAVWLIQNDFAH
jgi:HD-GYP domain-containing protein (c-di-GMP phosphodiesterase class II)